MQRPFVALAGGWLIGIGIVMVFGHHFWIYALLAIGLGGIGWIAYAKHGFPGWIVLLILGCWLSAAHFSWVEKENHTELAPLLEEGELAHVIGEIASPPVIDGDRLRLDLAVMQLEKAERKIAISKELIRLNVQLRSQEEIRRAKQLQPGDRITAFVTFERPSPARNPGGFDYRRYLKHQGIHWLGNASSLSAVKMIKSAKGMRETVNRWREQLSDRLALLFDGEAEGILQGMILGKREEVDFEVEESFSLLGLVHILSISGLHVSIFVGGLYWLFTRLGLTREKAACVILFALPIYAFLTGAEAPVIRSVFMAGLALWAILWGKWQDALSFLAVAFLLQMLWNPYQIFQAGFQLTFLVTAVLLVGTVPVSERLPLPWNWLRQAIAVGILAQAASFPIVVHHFQEYSFLSLPINLLIVPLYSVILFPGGMIALMLSFLHDGWGIWIAELVSRLIAVSQQLVTWLASLHAGFFLFPPPSSVWLIGYGVMSVYLFLTWISRHPMWKLQRFPALAGWLVLILYLILKPSWHPEETTIAFLDVGQGDASVIVTRSGTVILVDAGGKMLEAEEEWKERKRRFDAGRDVVVPFLKEMGIRRIDYLILTHGDLDHIGGAYEVAKRYPIGQVIRNPHPPQNPEEGKLIHYFRQQSVPIAMAQRGQKFRLDEQTILQFLHPDPRDLLGKAGKTNNDSVVFLLETSGKRVLFTGDIEQEAEEQLLKQISLRDVEILKVAHHGSSTSTTDEWLNESRPDHAVISVGQNNFYGHPAPEVLHRLQKQGVQIWRTDVHGAVIVQIGQGTLRVLPFLKPESYTGFGRCRLWNNHCGMRLSGERSLHFIFSMERKPI